MSTSSTPESPASVGAIAPDTVLQDRYRIVRRLGKGGMGAVYEAVDQRLGITVALKETLSIDANVRKQFEQEARLLASLQHPALPRVSDHFAEGDRAYLVMQFIAGADLARIIYQQPGPFPREQVVAWADQLLDALIYLHSQDRQVIHRDIKPHNLKLTATGQIALLDFGLAKAQPAESSTTSSSSFFGYTRQYSPLEQIQALSSGPHSDIYALGATLYHLLTGVRPADALTRAASAANGQGDPLKPANLVHPAVGSEIANILTKAMAQNPEQRYRSAAEFREALRRIGRRAPNRKNYQPYPAGSVLFSEVADDLELFKTLQTSRSGSSRSPALIASVVLLVLIAAAGIFYGYPQWQRGPAVAPKQPPAQSPTRTRPLEKGPNNTIRLTSRQQPASVPPAKQNDILSGRSERDDSDNVVADQVKRLEKIKLVGPSVAKRESVTETVAASGRLKAPSIRLPAAE
ncbi:MAG TPA: serine/threonine-protein kinase, partial [Pyrinomonadaceae bacterium]|nr:serine/threonine-protein kinase [Pyrinomonadaceae bacterium]